MKVALYSRELKADAHPTAKEVADKFLDRRDELLVHENLVPVLKNYVSDGKVKPYSSADSISPDLLIALGGDGTILDTVDIQKGNSYPVLGINLGRLGFMAGVGRDELDECIEDIHKGTLLRETRSLLQLDSPHAEGRNLALNECAITNKDRSVLIEIKVWVENAYLSTYWADGLIISTATGSTGYSLSCGGPILLPTSRNFIITPIAPHNLNVRPLVVPESSHIKFRIENEEGDFLLSMDSHSRTIRPGQEFVLKKADHDFTLLSLSKGGFINALKSKLFWGQDLRNA